MQSSPRTVSILVNNLEQRLKNLQTSRLHEEQTCNDFDALVNECSNHLNRITSSSDSTSVAYLLPCLLQISVTISKICTENADTIPSSSRDQLTASTKTLSNQIKEFIKSPNTVMLMSKSPEQRHFCEQLHLVTDSITNFDPITTLFCQKLLVKTLTGGDEPQLLSQMKLDDTSDGLVVAVYNSTLKQMSIIYAKHFREKSDTNREMATIKVNYSNFHR